MRIEWLLCPICKSKTRLQIREDTEMKTFLSTVQSAKEKQSSMFGI